mgnify:CR=1 FL=1
MAAEQWGEWVKAAFDVFLPALCHKLGYKKPRTAEDERKFWLSFSQGTAYRYFDSLRDLDKSPKDTFNQDQAVSENGKGMVQGVPETSKASLLATGVLILLGYSYWRRRRDTRDILVDKNTQIRKNIMY